MYEPKTLQEVYEKYSLSLLMSLQKVKTMKCFPAPRTSARKQRLRVMIEFMPPVEM